MLARRIAELCKKRLVIFDLHWRRLSYEPFCSCCVVKEFHAGTNQRG
jgi:hypothetical protein